MKRVRKRVSRTSNGARRSQASTEAILAATRRILSEEGYDALTIESVAREARASKPTIYKWWGTKQKLISDVYLGQAHYVDAAVAQGSIRQELEVHFAKLWQIWSDKNIADVSIGLFADALKSEAQMQQYRDDYLPRRRRPIVELLERAAERGELRSGVDAELVAELVCNFHLFRLLLGRPVTQEHMKASLEIALDGALAKAQARKTGPHKGR